MHQIRRTQAFGTLSSLPCAQHMMKSFATKSFTPPGINFKIAPVLASCYCAVISQGLLVLQACSFPIDPSLSIGILPGKSSYKRLSQPSVQTPLNCEKSWTRIQHSALTHPLCSGTETWMPFCGNWIQPKTNCLFFILLRLWNQERKGPSGGNSVSMNHLCFR